MVWSESCELIERAGENEIEKTEERESDREGKEIEREKEVERERERWRKRDRERGDVTSIFRAQIYQPYVFPINFCNKLINTIFFLSNNIKRE